MAIDGWLRSQMAAKKISQRALGMRSGVDHSTISRLLRGDQQPSHETVRALYGVLEGECPTCCRSPTQIALPDGRQKLPSNLGQPIVSVLRDARRPSDSDRLKA